MREVFYRWNGYVLKSLWDEKITATASIEIMGKGWAERILASQIDSTDKLCAHQLQLHFSEDEKGVSIEEDAYQLYLSVEDLEKSEMLPCVMLHIYLREMVEDDILPLHAAAVSIKGKTVLLLSETEGGKTSVMFELCRNYGARLISNDFFAGQLKAGILRRIAEDNRSLISFRKDLFVGDEASLPVVFKGNENRKYFTALELGLESYKEEKKSSVDFICWVELTDVGDNRTSTMSELEQVFRYHYNVVNILSGVSLMLFDAEGRWIQQLPSYLHKEILNRLHSNISMLCNSYQPQEYIGNLDYIVRQIIQGVEYNEFK